ncbi:hypothetical protein ET989_04755 [Propioniciclava sinopodophylli]|uniref:UPF0056 membrane protein n=1 Tax=Propioniciclava sinopodophylli TaxID=1837344 RepID=A0A4Q9KG55_9ACTN|nr:MarC family protein [Propioniciclava sinopodophylli]TBT86622.1 hypothetical protein ET989_04755 [Propioniciclava sinopodophylli]
MLGRFILDYLHITIEALQVSGGLLLLLVALALVWVFLRFAGAIRRVLHNSGTVLLTRVAGMLLAAIAVQMLADGALAFLRQV